MREKNYEKLKMVNSNAELCDLTTNKDKALLVSIRLTLIALNPGSNNSISQETARNFIENYEILESLDKEQAESFQCAFGLNLCVIGNYARAIPILESSLTSTTDNNLLNTIKYALTIAYLRQNNYESALANYRKISIEDRDNVFKFNQDVKRIMEKLDNNETPNNTTETTIPASSTNKTDTNEIPGKRLFIMIFNGLAVLFVFTRGRV
jgi:tetratricopeptide (TPR) repeat protein